MKRIAICCVLAASVCRPPGPARADDTALQLHYRASLGPEYDSNARREVAGGTVVQDGLVRAALAADGSLQLGAQRFDLSLSGGAKVFARERAENTGVAMVTLGYRLELDPTWQLGLDLFGRARRLLDGERDYTTGMAEAVVAMRGLGPLSLEARLGPRGFAYGPDSAFSNAGLGATLWTRLQLLSREQLAVALDLEGRVYPDAPQLLSLDATGTRELGSDPRLDLRPTLRLRAVSSRRLFISAGYDLGYDASNSLGETYLRHRLQLVVGTHLPLELFASATAGLQLTSYPGGLALSQRLLLEDSDESQNKLVLTLRRPLAASVELEMRLGAYSNELGQSGLAFTRLTAYLGMTYVY